MQRILCLNRNGSDGDVFHVSGFRNDRLHIFMVIDLRLFFKSHYLRQESFMLKLKCLLFPYKTDNGFRNAITQLIGRSPFVNKIYQKILVTVHGFKVQHSGMVPLRRRHPRASWGKGRPHLRNELFPALTQKIFVRHACNKIANDRCGRCLLHILLRHPGQKTLEDV